MNDKMQMYLAQEEELQLTSFTNEDALELGLTILRVAKEHFTKGIAVHIENDEHPLFTHFMAGTDKGNVFWIDVKKNVVNRFGHSSLYVGEHYRDQGTTFRDSAGLPDSEYRAEGGCFPLVIRGQGKIGTVTVSGLTGEEDHQVAVEGLRLFLSR